LTVLALPHGEAFRDEQHAEGNLEETARDGKGHADVVAEIAASMKITRQMCMCLSLT
jgi:hypothetical protein